MNSNAEDVALIIMVGILIIVFAGDPDLMDAIIARLSLGSVR